jgi:hypothetical protein
LLRSIEEFSPASADAAAVSIGMALVHVFAGGAGK